MQHLRSTYDVVVVGAGPAGTGAAAAFADRGAEVLLLEANPKAATRLAGEWIHPTGAKILERYGLLPADITAAHAPARGFTVFPDDGSEPIQLDYVDGQLGFSCEHGDLVDALRKRVAERAHVTYLDHARVTEIAGAVVRFKHQGQLREVRAERIVGADGRSSCVRKSIGGSEQADLVSHMAGVEIHDCTLPFEGYGHVLLGGPGPILLYRIGPNTVRACIDLPASHPTAKRDARYLWDAFAPRFPESIRPAFKRALEGERVVWACNRFSPRDLYGKDRVALIGDAVGFYHPLTASGITIGLKDAMTLLESKDVAEYQRRREPQSYVPELLANALNQVFVRDDEGAVAIRRAVFEIWREHPAERARTMNILAGEEVRLGQFGAAFLRVASRGVKNATQDGTPLSRFVEFAQWPLATVVPSRLRRRVRPESSPLHPLAGLRLLPPQPKPPVVPQIAGKPEVDVDALIGKVREHTAELSGPRRRALALLRDVREHVSTDLLGRAAKTVLLDLEATDDPRHERDAARALTALRAQHPGLVSRRVRDGLDALERRVRDRERHGAFGELEHTALAVETLAALGAPPFDPILRRAAHHLASKQRKVGGWGAETSLVCRAILAADLPLWDAVEHGFASLAPVAKLPPEAGEALRLYRDRRVSRVTPKRDRKAKQQTPQDDWQYCTESLLAVSRSFARPIQMLPGKLQEAVTCGYLLCRIADTIEDNAYLPTAERDLRYATFLAALEAPADSEVMREFERQWQGVKHDSEAEIDLAQHLATVMRVFRALPDAMQTKTARWVAEMVRGMQIYSHRKAGDDGMQALHTVEDLERYCYFVAGTVGHMLTDLFVEGLGHVGGDVEYALRTNAEAFGVGLQLVNILKDVTDDRQRNVSFIPRTSCHSEGFEVTQLIDPVVRDNAHAAVAPLFARAQQNLDRALDYTLAIPSDAPEVRLFCLLPLFMAVRTLVHARGNDAMFTTGAPVKIARSEVEQLIADCLKHAKDDAALRDRYDALWAKPANHALQSASIH